MKYKFQWHRRVYIENYFQVKGEITTLLGINRIFCYIVTPNGEVQFRKFPCFCDNCAKLNMKDCEFTELAGVPEIVVRPGQNIRKNANVESDSSS